MNELKRIFLQNLDLITMGESDVAVCLSSGIDSTSNMLGLLELKKNVRAYSFHIEGVQSQDFVHARANAKTFGVEFIECVIPNEVNVDIVIEIISDYKRKKKTDIECIYPFYYLFPLVKEHVVLTGAYADVHFCISKNAMIHFRHTLELMNQCRMKLFKNKDTSQITELAQMARERFGLRVETAFDKMNMINYFADKTWDEINRPRQKQAYVDMFPEQFEKIRRFNHTSLQCGDSQIRELFEPLLNSEILNVNKRKRMMDLYRDLYFEFHSNERKKNGKG
ncbi:MAG: asparagine synthase-related protein [Planctomycetota bacterium]